MKRFVPWSAAALTLATAVTCAPAYAVAPQAWLPPTPVISVGAVPFTSAATLPNGAVGVVWSNGSSIYLKIRRPGAVAFSSAMTYAAPASFPNPAVGGNLSNGAIQIKALTASTFLVGWIECGGTCRLVMATVPSSATSFPAATEVSDGQNVIPQGFDFATLPDGSAAAVWLVSNPTGFTVTVNRRIGLGGTWGAVTSSSEAAVTNFPDQVRVSLDTAKSITAVWVVANASYDIAVRTRVGAAAWGLKSIVGSLPPGGFNPYASVSSIASSTGGTVLAVVDRIPGAVPSNYTPDPVATGITVLTQAAGSSQWAVARSGITGSGRHALRPAVLVAPSGGAVVQFGDFASRAISPSSPNTQVSSMVVQRTTASGAWSQPALLDAASVVDPVSFYLTVRWQSTLLPDGTLITGVPAPLGAPLNALFGAGVVVRSGWGGVPRLALTAGASTPVFPVATGIDATGRSNVIYFRVPDGKIFQQSSSLVAPRPYSGPALSAAPRKGTAVSCSVVWAGASGAVSYRWLRNGSVISGATAASYTPKAADVGKQLACRSVATNSAGTSRVTSAARKVTN